ncbi:MAG: glycosyltransferase [Scytonematopsis contorta HA4267-MV1]|jgi:hypothetical protein|nr:glycosyltransferase [Scytonematopsis contorta HA4267-MV1]
MRIFIAVRHSNNQKQFYGALWSGNFYPALQQLGHEIIESQVDLLPASRFMQIANNFTSQELEVRAQITQKIIDEVKEVHRQKPIDLFLSYFYNSHFDTAGFAEINALGIPTVNFYCNSIYQFQLVSEIAAKVNYSWHAEKDARSLYLKAGANPIWVQMGADPEVYRPVPGISQKSKACFVGQRYADRDRWMAALVRAEIPLEIYGPGWGEIQSAATNKSAENNQPEEYLGRKQAVPGNTASYLRVVFNNIKTQGVWDGLARNWQQIQYRQETKKLSPLFPPFAKGAIPFQQICSVFSSYEVILNFSNVWADGTPGSKLIPHVRLRDFEAPMSRTCYLTGYTEEITNFYELGKEIDTYHTAEELVDKTKFYLSHPAEAEKLRNAGYQRALSDHTWKRRFEQLFAAINL